MAQGRGKPTWMRADMIIGLGDPRYTFIIASRAAFFLAYCPAFLF